MVNGIIDLVGNTPLVNLANLKAKFGLRGNVLAKIESFNPGGSVKDRIALAMIEDAEEKGLLKAGATIIEPTSGNTGIGIAAICAAKGYHAIMTMPETMSKERMKLLAAYGAEVVLTSGRLGMRGAIDKAKEIHENTENSIILGQFTNPANPRMHVKTTGPEIWKQAEGKVDVFIAGVGTGGTLSGVGEYLKSVNKDVEIIAVEPKGSPMISEGKAGPHMIQGIGAGFIPDTFNRAVCDRVITVENEDAIKYARELAKNEGILVGFSSGAALSVAISLAEEEQYNNKNIVVLLPDTGERYLSTNLF